MEACVAAWGRLNATNLTVVGNRQTPFSTHAEDLTALRVVMTLRGARDAASLWSRGTFVELGAFDGVTESNSQLFERCLNWTGVLVEPNPRAWEALREHRAARPRAHLYHASPTCNESDDDATARIANHAYTSSALLAAGATRGGALVACTSMARVLRHARVDAIDVWSLDVEGSEADDNAARLAKVTRPCLVYGGSHSFVRGSIENARAVAAGVSGPARVLIYDDARGTHSPQQPEKADGGEGARQFCADVAAFLLAPEDVLRSEAGVQTL